VHLLPRTRGSRSRGSTDPRRQRASYSTHTAAKHNWRGPSLLRDGLGAVLRRLSDFSSRCFGRFVTACRVAEVDSNEGPGVVLASHHRPQAFRPVAPPHGRTVLFPLGSFPRRATAGARPKSVLSLSGGSPTDASAGGSPSMAARLITKPHKQTEDSRRKTPRGKERTLWPSVFAWNRGPERGVAPRGPVRRPSRTSVRPAVDKASADRLGGIGSPPCVPPFSRRMRWEMSSCLYTRANRREPTLSFLP